jgi:hypothetical protein
LDPEAGVVADGIHSGNKSCFFLLELDLHGRLLLTQLLFKLLLRKPQLADVDFEIVVGEPGLVVPPLLEHALYSHAWHLSLLGCACVREVFFSLLNIVLKIDVVLFHEQSHAVNRVKPIKEQLLGRREQNLRFLVLRVAVVVKTIKLVFCFSLSVLRGFV